MKWFGIKDSKRVLTEKDIALWSTTRKIAMIAKLYDIKIEWLEIWQFVADARDHTPSQWHKRKKHFNTYFGHDEINNAFADYKEYRMKSISGEEDIASKVIYDMIARDYFAAWMRYILTGET